MQKKIFLIVGSLGAGGSERVYWLLSQYFNKPGYAVYVVFLNAQDECFSTSVNGIRFIDLKTIKASRSFFKLYKLLKAEKPYAVFSTTDHINILTAMVACFLKVPNLIARASNMPHQMKQFYDYKARFYYLFTRFFFMRFNFIVCQSEEMQQAITNFYHVNTQKLKVIHNPVLISGHIKHEDIEPAEKKLLVVARLSKEKGLFRLLGVINELPKNYTLTIAGDGHLKDELQQYVIEHQLQKRVSFLGKVKDVAPLIANHDLMVLSSFTEGFPNVILEALSVGVPVVSFRVGGVQELIVEGFNGYIAEQYNTAQFKQYILRACTQNWPHKQIKADAANRFALDKIGRAYEDLLCNASAV